MPETEPFILNLSDLDDLRVKLKRARETRDERIAKRDRLKPELEAVEAAVDEWAGIVAFIESRVPESRETAPAPAPASTQDGPSTVDLAVEVVNREMRKIRARDVWQTLLHEGHDLGRVQVSNALHYAAHKARRIQSPPGRGYYAPNDYAESVIFGSANGAGSPDAEDTS